MPAGRPSGYTEEIAAEICVRLTEGKSLRSICAEEDMPSMRAVLKWLEQHEEFQRQYARAREAQADALFDDVLTIADAPATEAETVDVKRLRIDARKWMAGKLRPKKYGDKLELEHGVTDELSELMHAVNGKTRGLPGGG